MIFALATDEGSLHVFGSSFDATAHCEGIDVEDGGWLFWDWLGAPLVARFDSPNRRGALVVESGNYSLVSARGLPCLAEVLSDIRAIDSNPWFPNLASVAEHLRRAPRLPA